MASSTRSAQGTQAGFAKLESKVGPATISVDPIEVGQTGSVTFNVVDQAGDPVIGVGPLSSLPWVTGTDRYTGVAEDLGEGRYRLTHIIPGLEQVLLLYAEGYRGWSPRDPFTLESGETRELGTYTIKWGDLRALPEYIAGLDDAEKREYFAELIGYLGADGAPAVPRLTELLRTSATMQSRYGIAIALGKIGPSASQAVPALIEALEQDECPVRRDAAEALGLIGDPAAVPALTAALADAEWEVCRNAVEALARIGPGAGEAVPDLTQLAKTAKRSDVRRAAIKGLGHIGGSTVLPVLTEFRQHKSQGTRQCALEAIDQITRRRPDGPSR